MADKQVNQLSTIPAVADSDLLTMYDGSEAGTEKLKKITAANLYAYIYNKISLGDVTNTTLVETAGASSSFFGPALQLIQSSVVVSSAGGIFRVEAGSAFLGVGTGEVQLFLYLDGGPLRMSQVMPFGNVANGNSTQVGATSMYVMFQTSISTSYTLQLYATTYGVGETATCNTRYIYVTEFIK
jgi:hypothetical protein